jgi:hypothetical protein
MAGNYLGLLKAMCYFPNGKSIWGIFALFESLEEIQDEVPENGMTIHNYLS